jgi:hypothetical protein
MDYPIIWAGIAILVAGAYGLKWYDKKWCKPSPPLTPEPLEFKLITTGNYEVDGIGEGWDMFPEQKRLVYERGLGGPDVREVYEYAVRDTNVFVRLLEKSTETAPSDERKYQVFGGSINRARLEEDDAKLVKKGEEWDDDTKRILLRDTPETISADLQKEIVWHEVYGAIRYFVLSKDTSPSYIDSFYKDELERFTDASIAIEKKAKELGAVWSNFRYKAPEGMTPEAKEEIEKQLRVFNFGFRNANEFRHKDVILGVLKDALGEKQ